jgi:hypothetical protein
MSNTQEKSTTRTWQEIAAEAAKETDPEKLLALSAELCRALEERDKTLRTTARPSQLLTCAGFDREEEAPGQGDNSGTPRRRAPY